MKHDGNFLERKKIDLVSSKRLCKSKEPKLNEMKERIGRLRFFLARF